MEIRETAARLRSKNLRDGCAALDAGEDNPNAYRWFRRRAKPEPQNKSEQLLHGPKKELLTAEQKETEKEKCPLLKR